MIHLAIGHTKAPSSHNHQLQETMSPTPCPQAIATAGQQCWDRMKLRIAGAMFIGAFFAYGIGTGLATDGIESLGRSEVSSEHRRAVYIGTMLMLVNSAFVLSIGTLLFSMLSRCSRLIAWTYLAVRAGESFGLAVGALCLLWTCLGEGGETRAACTSAGSLNQIFYWGGMALLGIGSLVVFGALYRCRIIPRYLAAWGVIGYASLAAGIAIDMDGQSCAIALMVPGGLFELWFGGWLIGDRYESYAGK